MIARTFCEKSRILIEPAGDADGVYLNFTDDARLLRLDQPCDKALSRFCLACVSGNSNSVDIHVVLLGHEVDQVIDRSKQRENPVSTGPVANSAN